jgi:SAM-dependent methyltransferase
MAYTIFDTWLAWLRYRAVLPHLRPDARVCDIGCGVDMQFLRWAQGRIGFGVGLDLQKFSQRADPRRVIRTDVTKGLPVRDGQFDHAVMLAVLEHLREPEATLREVFRILAPGGSLILTWPSALIDPTLKILHRSRIVSDEMASDQHQDRLPVVALLALLRGIGFERCVHQTFEFGLNNLLVAHKLGHPLLQ